MTNVYYDLIKAKRDSKEERIRIIETIEKRGRIFSRYEFKWLNSHKIMRVACYD